MAYTPEEQALDMIFEMLEYAIERHVHADIYGGVGVAVVTMAGAMDYHSPRDCRRVTIGRETYRVQITRIRPQAGE